MKRVIAFAALFVVTLTGCWEVLSWSPDGRYLAFVNPPGSVPWRWDTRTDTATSLGGAPAMQVFYLDSSDRMVTLHELEEDSDYWRMVYRDLREGASHEVVAKTTPYGFAISHDRKTVYTIEEQGEGDSVVLIERSIADPTQSRELYRAEHDVLITAGDSTQGLLLTETIDESYRISRLDPSNAGAQPERVFESDRELWPSTWIDAGRFAVTRELPDGARGKDDLGELVVVSVANGEARVLHDLVLPYPRPSLNAAGDRLLVTGVEHARWSGFVQELYSSVQLLSIDIASGEVIALTDEALGAGYGAYRPQHNTVAYISPPDLESEAATVRILDLDTGEKTIVWRNDEERRFATAEQLYDAGKRSLAKAAYEEIAKQSGSYTDLAAFRVASLALDGPTVDLDLAYGSARTLSPNWRAQILDAFWRDENIVARDADSAAPVLIEPVIESSEAAEETTTLDFETLYARWSDSRLYLRIVAQVPSGSPAPRFENVAVLFDHDSIGDGTNTVWEGLTWDRYPSRQVHIRSWNLDNQGQTQTPPPFTYDTELRDVSGETIARLTTKGYARPKGGPIVVDGLHAIGGGRYAADLVLSRRALKLTGAERTHIQVAAIEVIDGAPRVIDAFGDDEAEAEARQIHGTAAQLTLN